MIKLMIVGRRAPGMTRATAHRHLREVHGPMVVHPPADAGAMPRDYVQNHVLDGVYPTGTGRHAIDRDLITELWFDTLEHLRQATQTPYYLSNLKPDEPRFVDDGTVEKMLVSPVTITQGGTGRFKAFLMIGEADTAAITSRLRQANGVGTIIINGVRPGPDGTPPFADAIIEAWFDDREDAERAILGFDGLALLAEQYDTARLLGRGAPCVTSPPDPSP